MGTWVSKLDNEHYVFGAVSVVGRAKDVRFVDTVVSEETTHNIEHAIRHAFPASANTDTREMRPEDGFMALVVTDSSQTKPERVLLGRRVGNELEIHAQVNLDRKVNPSGAAQMFEPIRIQLQDAPNTAPSEDGLRMLRAMLDSGKLVGKPQHEQEFMLASDQQPLPTPSIGPARDGGRFRS